MFASGKGWKTVDFSSTVCTDELGPVVPRTFPPAPGWSVNGHRIKAPLDYSRGPEKAWVYGALRVRDGKELTQCAASRNSTDYIALLRDIEAGTTMGDIYIITDNLSSHNSAQTRAWPSRASPAPSGLHSRLSRAGSTCKRAGGGSSAAMLWLDRVLPTPPRLSRPLASRQFNSIDEPNRRSGVDLPRIIAIIAISFLTAFKERSSNSIVNKNPTIAYLNSSLN
jgi:hypothetical protein